jgi:hypothetical protein
MITKPVIINNVSSNLILKPSEETKFIFNIDTESLGLNFDRIAFIK